MPQRRRQLTELAEQLGAAQRAGQMDVFSRQEAPGIESTGVAEIARHACAHQRFDTVASAQHRKCLARLGYTEIADAQAAGYRNSLAADFDLLELQLITSAPGQVDRVLTQPPAPAQRFAGIHSMLCDHIDDVI